MSIYVNYQMFGFDWIWTCQETKTLTMYLCYKLQFILERLPILVPNREMKQKSIMQSFKDFTKIILGFEVWKRIVSYFSFKPIFDWERINLHVWMQNNDRCMHCVHAPAYAFICIIWVATFKLEVEACVLGWLNVFCQFHSIQVPFPF